MTKSIIPNKDIFQWAIRHKPTGKYLKKTPGQSFYATDIPSVYNSPKVALRSLENESGFNHLCKLQDCEIVKFRLFMEEVKEPTPNELAYAEDLEQLTLLRKITGEIKWEEVESERGRSEIFSFIRHIDPTPMSEGSSLHCYDKVFKTVQGLYQFTWTHDQSLDEIPISIRRGIEYNWDQRIQELKIKHDIS